MPETIFRNMMSLITGTGSELMVGTIDTLLVGHIKEGMIEMSQTLEEFRESMRQRGRELLIPTPEDIVKAFPAEEIFRVFPAEERLRGLPAEERLKGLSPEEIEAYLKKLRKKAKPAKKEGSKNKKSA